MCIRDRGLPDPRVLGRGKRADLLRQRQVPGAEELIDQESPCLLYTSDAADERSSVDLGGRRIIKKKTKTQQVG